MKNADVFLKKVLLHSDIELWFFVSGYFHYSVVLDYKFGSKYSRNQFINNLLLLEDYKVLMM